jgi:cytochrome c oxidase subunit I+III
VETRQQTRLANDDTAELERTWASEPGIIGWLSQVNHREIGKRYIVTGSIFFLLAGLDALRIRMQLAVPEADVISAATYNAAFTMHGTTMMFLFALPIMEGIGIYLVPLMIGARDMAMPRLNAFGYWVYLIAGVSLYVAYIFGVPPTGGWFAYPPLARAEFAPELGMDFWATMITFIEIAALVAAVELIVTILKQRAPGMSLGRMPVLVWSVLVMAFMIIFAMPPLMVTSLMLALDRAFQAQFFNAMAGGEPLLWQHLFWFFGHPDVYIMMLPGFGILSAVFVAAARRPIFGYTAVVLSTVAIGFISFGLWVHHMFATGLPMLGLSFFTGASMMVALPGAVLIFCWIATLWNGSIVVNTAFLYAIGAVITFVLGGVTGVMLASVPLDLQVHDTFFVVAHFHYVLFGAVVFPLVAGFHHWFPKVTGRLLDERIGAWSFWTMFGGFHLTFFPQHFLGAMGMPRRVFTYIEEVGWGELNLLSTVGAFIIALGVLLLVMNVLSALLSKVRPEARDPWRADSLEWATSSPPASYSFQHIPTVRSRYPRWFADGPEQPVVELRSDRRETPLTDAVDAIPQGRIVLPGPTLLPLYLAFSIAFAFLGLIAHPVMLLIGALFAGGLLLRWVWPPKHERGGDE